MAAARAMQLLPPDREALDEIYSKYYGSYPTFASDPEMDERHREFMEFLVAAGVPMSGHALEIGSYDGRFLARLQSVGMTVHGCDPNAAAAAEAERAFGVTTTLEYFTPDTFPEDSFDFVSARLVLEHVTEPDTFLSGLQKVVRTNGHVALEVPDCGIVMAEGAPFWMYEHPNYFTATSLLRGTAAARLRRHGDLAQGHPAGRLPQHRRRPGDGRRGGRHRPGARVPQQVPRLCRPLRRRPGGCPPGRAADGGLRHRQLLHQPAQLDLAGAVRDRRDL